MHHHRRRPDPFEGVARSSALDAGHRDDELTTAGWRSCGGWGAKPGCCAALPVNPGILLPKGRRPRLGGRSRTQGGTWSAWHVHPGYDTYVFQTEGRLRLEFGAGGTESMEGGPGDFVLIPKGLVHRERNPGTEPNEAIVFRVGEGEVLVNVDGPWSAGY